MQDFIFNKNVATYVPARRGGNAKALWSLPAGVALYVSPNRSELEMSAALGGTPIGIQIGATGATAAQQFDVDQTEGFWVLASANGTRVFVSGQ